MTTILYLFWDGWSAAGGGATLVGQWSNIIPCRSSNVRIDCQSSNQRIECRSSNARLET